MEETAGPRCGSQVPGTRADAHEHAWELHHGNAASCATRHAGACTIRFHRGKYWFTGANQRRASCLLAAQEPRRDGPATGSHMGRLSAVFIAFCMVMIAASIGIVTWLSFGFTGMEASVVTIAVL